MVIKPFLLKISDPEFELIANLMFVQTKFSNPLFTIPFNGKKTETWKGAPYFKYSHFLCKYTSLSNFHFLIGDALLWYIGGSRLGLRRRYFCRLFVAGVGSSSYLDSHSSMTPMD